MSFILPMILSIILSILCILFWTKFFIKGIDYTGKIQKIHRSVAIRLGGLIIILSFLISGTILYTSTYFLLIFTCLLPLIAVGLFEDLFQNLSIRSRLIGMICSALLLVIVNDSYLSNIDTPFFSDILNIKILAVLFTVFGIVATINAWNFIDGVNGLASGLGAIILIFFLTLGDFKQIDDLKEIILIIAGATVGFFIINIITGKIFLGDSGAYLLGSIIAWTGVEISSKSSDVSPWLVFFIILYPASELIISTMRRLITRRSPFFPDNMHFHTLFNRLLIKIFYSKNLLFINSLSGLLLVVFGAVPIIIIANFNIYYPTILLITLIVFIMYFINWLILKFLDNN